MFRTLSNFGFLSLILCFGLGLELLAQRTNAQVRSPGTEDFFEGGQRVFPRSVQQGSPRADRLVLDVNTQAPEDYPVGPGDQYLVNFWGRVEDNILVSINSEGVLFIPRIGVIDTDGMNYGELRAAMEKAIGDSLRDVQFTISLYRPREFRVFVLGSVNRPGPVRASATLRASEIVAMAGGIPSIGSSQFIELRRRGEVQRVDLTRFASLGDFSLNPFVTDGDVIFVPNLSDFVTITGAVVSPGTFEIRETRNLSEVIQRLGGLSVYADRASPFRLSRLQSDGTRTQIQVLQREDQRRTDREVLLESLVLQNGDEIFIPSTQLLIPSKSNSVFVTGAVRAPGAKPYQISTSVEEYIGFAGGLTERANFSSAVVYKADGSSIRLSPRLSVEPGDTIYIPEKTFKFWQDHVSLVSTFILLATQIIVFSGR
ncbi:MAG: hypothetical protein EA369_01245 [Bradymonadales bacterium]|nr:MAG: hypothetical protein EA369_01245 [Bradymonadales bacterium]